MPLAFLALLRCEHFDVLAQPKQRKLCALALCLLLQLPSRVPLAFLDVLLGCITGACGAEVSAGVGSREWPRALLMVDSS